MYRRYTNINREGAPLNQIKQIRIRDVIIVVLLAGLVALAIIAFPSFSYQGDERTLYIRKMAQECNTAADKREQYLKAGSSGDAAQRLAEIRGHLCAIQTLNDMYLLQRKELLIPDDRVNSCIKVVDSYYNDISTGGKNLTVLLTDLRLAMNQLQEEIGNLE